MHLRTFSAGTMAGAVYQGTRAMGGAAVILHPPPYWRRRWLGLRRVEVVEITAGSGLQGSRGNTRRPIARQQTAPAPTAPRPAPPPGGQQLLQTQAASNAVILGLSQDLGSLKTMVLD